MVCDAKCDSKARLDGKTAVITGSNTGIGIWTARDFYLRGAKVIMACRNLEKAEKARNEIMEQTRGAQNVGTLKLVELDLSSLESVRTCAQKLLQDEEQINLLINNAGICACPYEKTKDGFEMQMGTNHLAHLSLTLLLLPKIIKSAAARIVTVSSDVHFSGKRQYLDDLNWEKYGYSAYQAYNQSKLANAMMSFELDRRLKEANIKGVNTYSLHPGAIKTEVTRHLDKTYFPGATFMVRNVMGMFFKSPENGAQTTIHCAVSEKAADESGLYYAECKPKKSSPIVTDEEACKKLWNDSLKLIALDPNYNPFRT